MLFVCADDTVACTHVPGANVHTTSSSPLRQSGLCPTACLPPGTPGSDLTGRPADVVTLSERSPSASVVVPGDAQTVGGLGWAILQLRAGVTYDVTFDDRQPGRVGQSDIRALCCPAGAYSCSCATRVRMVLVGTDGNTVVAKSTGIGGARVPGMPDGIQGTRNTPIIGFTAPTDGQYFLAVYDYHIEGGGPVPVTLEVNNRPTVLCSDRPDSNCVDEYPDQCIDQRNWVILPDHRNWRSPVDCHYFVNNGWCKSDGTAGWAWDHEAPPLTDSSVTLGCSIDIDLAYAFVNGDPSMPPECDPSMPDNTGPLEACCGCGGGSRYGRAAGTGH